MITPRDGLDDKTISFLSTPYTRKCMANNIEKCSSCKTEVTNVQGTARFKCPQCTKQEVIRCERCRRLAAKYTCPECSFEGPN